MRLDGLKSAELNGATGYLGDRKDLAEARVNIHLIDATAPNGGKAVAVRILSSCCSGRKAHLRQTLHFVRTWTMASRGARLIRGLACIPGM